MDGLVWLDRQLSHLRVERRMVSNAHSETWKLFAFWALQRAAWLEAVTVTGVFGFQTNLCPRCGLPKDDCASNLPEPFI